MKRIISLVLGFSFIPFVTFASPSSPITDLKSLIDFFSKIISEGILPLLIGVAVVAFVYGIIQYFLNPDNEEKRKQGKSYITWGLVALFVMVSFWGIVGIAQKTFDTDGTDTVKIPKIPTN